MKRTISGMFVLCFLVLMMFSSTVKALPADNAPDFVPLGVYLSWELPHIYAKHYKIDFWQYLTRQLDACEQNNVNLLWVTNMLEPDLPRLIAECEKRNMKLVVSMSVVEGRIEWRWANDAIYYKKLVPNLVKTAGDSKTLVGWVLSDEPTVKLLPKIEELRKLFRKFDPNRFCLSVTMWPQTPMVPKLTNLPVVCVDLYPFFGPDDPNGPHTDVASRNFFRTNIQRMVEAIGDKEVASWVMPQCFVENWGPFKYDERGHLISLPGAFPHWRGPTVAEMRWQTWESFRSGGKGVIFFQLSPIMGIGAGTTTRPATTRIADELKMKKPTDAGVAGLMTVDAKATLQFIELGKMYKFMSSYLDIIGRWKVTPLLLVEADTPGKVQCFVDPQSGRYFAIVVNDDLHKSQTIQLNVEVGTKKLVNLKTGKALSIKSHFNGGNFDANISLVAGDGALLEIIR